MSMEWSYTQEGLESIRERIGLESKEFLDEVYAEHMAYIERNSPGVRGDYNGAAFYRGMRQAQGLPFDTVAETVWDLADAFRVCENDFKAAWVCPYGCHKVLVSPPAEGTESGKQ